MTPKALLIAASFVALVSPSPAMKFRACNLREIIARMLAFRRTIAPITAAIDPARVSQPIPGLFDAIPSNIDILNGPEWRFQHVVESKSPARIRTDITYAHPTGDLDGETRIEAFQVRREKFVVVLRNADFSDFTEPAGVTMPSRILHPQLVPLTEQGTPVGTLAILSAMKRIGVTYGSVTRFEIRAVENLETRIELAGLEKAWKQSHPGKNFNPKYRNQFFVQTAMYRFIETTIVQSGHRPTSIRITNGQGHRMGGPDYSSSALPPSQLAQLTTLWRKFGLEPDDPSLYQFDVTIGVSPF